MNKDDCFYLGYISKTHGYKGELIVKLDVDFPENYQNLNSVFLTSCQEKALFSISIQQIAINNKGIARIKIADVNSIDKAKPLIGHSLYLPLSLLPLLKGKQFYYHEIIGFKVNDKIHGNIGIVEEVLEFPHQAVIQVMKNQKEILIPVTDEIINIVDRKNKILEVNTPDGLIEIYK